MRALIQRVSRAEVRVDDQVSGKIEKGLLVLLGIMDDDNDDDMEWLSRKISQLRIFNDDEGKMNLSIQDVGGDILVVSQFTLYADSKKGNRPSFNRSAKPEISGPLYERFLMMLNLKFEGNVESGEFGAHMEVELVNHGPVTLMLDSRQQDF